jgi:hypothetical protein
MKRASALMDIENIRANVTAEISVEDLCYKALDGMRRERESEILTLVRFA